MEVLEQTARLEQLGDEIRDADAAMVSITQRIAVYRKERGLPLLVDGSRHANVADPYVQELDNELARANRTFSALLQERADLMKRLGLIH